MSLDHQQILIISLALLLAANFSKYKSLSIFALCLLIYDALAVFKISSSSGVFHYSVDLILIAFLSSTSQFLNSKILKFCFALISCGVLLLLHPLNHTSQTNEAALSNKLESNLELLVQMKSEDIIQNWILNNKKTYDITFPLFKPHNTSGVLDEYLGINVAAESNLTEVIKKLESDPHVIYVETNELLELKLPDVKSNPKTAGTGSLDPQSNKQWMVEKLNLEQFHKTIQEKTAARKGQTIIAILDTGIAADHEDLTENYISFDKSYDRDSRGHGTHCAGIAAAVTGNNIGILSLLPPQSSIKITSVKVLSNLGLGAQHQIIAGIIEAVDKGADVISLSFGAPSLLEKEHAYQEAVTYANNRGAIIIAAAGNSNDDAAKYSPANTRGVIVVTAVGPTLRKTSFGNSISNVEFGIAAPGLDIYSTTINNNYVYQSGTSMAAPFVAGLVGLMKSYDPEMTTREAYELMAATAINENGLLIVNPIGVLNQITQ